VRALPQRPWLYTTAAPVSLTATHKVPTHETALADVRCVGAGDDQLEPFQRVAAPASSTATQKVAEPQLSAVSSPGLGSTPRARTQLDPSVAVEPP